MRLMNARTFLRQFRVDERLASGDYFATGGLDVLPGDHVGVVLLSLGGPRNRSELEDYLYSRWMDPVLYARVPRIGRHVVASVGAKLAAAYFWRDYEEIGGDCPSNRLVREQAAALEIALASQLAPKTGATYSTFAAARYGVPSVQDAIQAMTERGVQKAILLPTHPQYSIATTGASLAYWASRLSGSASPDIQFSSVVEYSVHPLYLQALSERIDQALQRFPKRLRPGVEILYCAEHAEVHGRMNKRDSFCDLAQATVERLTEFRGDGRRSEVVCFASGVRTGRSDEHAMRTVFQRLAERSVESILVVPLGLSTDHVWTTYTLDMLLRHVASEAGINGYEVVSGLNCHPLFISALVDVVEAQAATLTRRDDDSGSRMESSFMQGREKDLRSDCRTCRGPVRARDWGSTFHYGAAMR